MKTMAEMWDLHRRRSPHALAAVSDDRRLTYDELTDRAARLASAFARLGVGHQDRVAMMAMNRLEWFDFYCAAERFGFIAATVNFRLAAPEVAFILSDSDPTIFVFEGQYADLVGAIRDQLPGIRHFVCLDEPRPDWALSYQGLIASGDPAGTEIVPHPEDIVRLLYTSGTTGRPKGVARSQYADLLTAQGAYTNMAFRPLSSCLLSMPMFHLGAQVIEAAMHWGGGAVHLHRSFDPAATLATIARERIEMTLMVPAMLQQVLDLEDVAQYDVSSLYCITYSAAPMPVTLLRRALDVFGPIFVNVYGQTECGQGTAFYAREHRPDGDARDLQRLGSIGREHQFTAIRIVDDQGRDCAIDQPGEIIIKTDTAMSGYWRNPEATAETVKDGWVHTGDIGKIDEDRYIYLVDRKKDVIISGGENIYCREIEEALMAHPSVREVAVIGVPDSKWGEAVKAIVVAVAGTSPTEAELIDHCKGRIARYKHPRSVAFMDDLPRLASGKVHKVTLRSLFRS